MVLEMIIKKIKRYIFKRKYIKFKKDFKKDFKKIMGLKNYPFDFRGETENIKKLGIHIKESEWPKIETDIKTDLKNGIDMTLGEENGTI